MSWIKVTDKLPDDCDRVIIAEQIISGKNAWFVGEAVYREETGAFWVADDGEPYHPTYWMELPDPPRE